MDGDKWLTGVADNLKAERQEASSSSREPLTVRQLLLEFGYYRRGKWINTYIINKLDELGLRVVPDFENVWLDEKITIELDDDGVSGGRHDPTHRVSMLEAAHNRPISVSLDDPISVATTLMLLHDYSQLPVMRGERDVEGMVRWKSIGARLSLDRPCEYVRDCKERAEVVDIEASLFEVIGSVAESGCVLVKDHEKRICGIVTRTDLSDQFAKLAGPFLLSGQIEGHLRNLIHGKLSVAELKECAVAGDSSGREINGSADLTLGDYYRLLCNQDRWNQLELKIDRKVFVKNLDSVRKIRNNVMHFSPEGLSEEDVRVLRDSAAFFENLVHMGAM